GPSCSNTNAVCYARIYVPWDAINDGKGSFANGTCAASPSGPGTPAAVFEQQLSAAARAVGVSHVLVSLTTASPATQDDIWPTDREDEGGLSGRERGAPGVTDWEVLNEPDSNYGAASTGSNCTQRNGVWVGSYGSYQCVVASHGAGGNGHGGSAQAAAHWYLD